MHSKMNNKKLKREYILKKTRTTCYSGSIISMHFIYCYTVIHSCLGRELSTFAMLVEMQWRMVYDS